MRVAVAREVRPGERRVALTPETAATLVGAGATVIVESGAGAASLAADADYREAGAAIAGGAGDGGGAVDVFADAEVVLHVRPLLPAEIARLRPGTVTIGFMSPGAELDGVRLLRDAGVTAFSMELVPRISRAQSMDALTSQALVSGYRCALEAAMRLPRFFPLFMTAAGTVPPARVLVLGAGVAGLQAIATAKRLGAVVEAYDVRPASADEVRSVGAVFVQLELESLEGAGGYAREMGEDRAARQRELLAPYVAKSDVLITTAAVPGRPAPLLVTREMIAAMKPGSVVVDLAAESGGNVEGSVAGADLDVEGVVLVGMADTASAMPADASRLYAKNVANLLALMIKDNGQGAELVVDLSDEVLDGACVTHAGAVHHGPTRELVDGPQPAAPATEETA
ncbi:MAG: NAD(P) transhydrogenase subunit alpha [Actinomycetota bacterium]|nr:NAD(P) transhydrogenase subunit alpha [Actinomycetota bacterium]